MNLTIHNNSTLPPRMCKDDSVVSINDYRGLSILINEWWMRRIPTDKIEAIVYHCPNDFQTTWCPNTRTVKPPKYHFYNIVNYINFINWLKYESMFYYLGMPKLLKQRIESFFKMVSHYIPNYIYYTNA